MADGLVVAEQVLFGEECANVWCFSNMPETLPAMQEMADNIRVLWNLTLAPEQDNNWTLNSLLFVLDPGPSQFSVRVPFTSGPLVGGDAGDALPNQTALLVSTSALAPRPNRGRVYFAGVTEGDLTAGVWSSDALDGATDLVTGLAIDGVEHADGRAFLRIARRDAAGAIEVSNPVEGILARAIPATQRRRRRSG